MWLRMKQVTEATDVFIKILFNFPFNTLSHLLVTLISHVYHVRRPTVCDCRGGLDCESGGLDPGSGLAFSQRGVLRHQ